MLAAFALICVRTKSRLLGNACSCCQRLFNTSTLGARRGGGRSLPATAPGPAGPSLTAMGGHSNVLCEQRTHSTPGSLGRALCSSVGSLGGSALWPQSRLRAARDDERTTRPEGSRAARACRAAPACSAPPACAPPGRRCRPLRAPRTAVSVCARARVCCREAGARRAQGGGSDEAGAPALRPSSASRCFVSSFSSSSSGAPRGSKSAAPSSATSRSSNALSVPAACRAPPGRVR